MAEKRKPREAFGIASKPLLGGVFKQLVSSLVQSRYDNAYPGVSDAYLPYIDPYATLSKAQEYRQFDQQLMAQDQEQRALGAIEKLWQDPSANRSTGLRQIIGENPLASSSPMLQAYLEADKLTSRTGAATNDPYIRGIKDPQARTEYQRALQQGLSPDDAYTQALFNEEDRAVSTSISDRGLDPNKYMRNGKIDRNAAKKDLDEQEKIRPSVVWNDRIKSTSRLSKISGGLKELDESLAEQRSTFGPYQERLTRFDDESYLSGLDPSVKKELSNNPPFDNQGNLTPYWSEKIEKDRASKIASRVRPQLNDLIRDGIAIGEISDETGVSIEEIQSILNPKSASKTVQNPAQTTELPLNDQVPNAAVAPVESITAPSTGVEAAPQASIGIKSISDLEAEKRDAEIAAIMEQRKPRDEKVAEQWQAAKESLLSGLEEYANTSNLPMQTVLAELARNPDSEASRNIAQAIGIGELSSDEAGSEEDPLGGRIVYKKSPVQAERWGSNAVTWREILTSLLGSGNNSSRDLLVRYGVTPEQLKNSDIGGLPKASTQAERDALPSGSEYIAPNGQVKRKL